MSNKPNSVPDKDYDKMAENYGYKIMIAGVILLIILANTNMCSKTSSTSTKTETTSSSGNCTTKEGHFASASRATVEKSAEIAASGDTAAFQQLLLSGNAIQLTGGKKVFLVDQSLGMIQFRIEGQTESYWAQRNAISCN